MGQNFDCGMATPSLTQCPVSLLEVGSKSSFSPRRAFNLGSLLLGSLSISPPRSLVHSGGSPISYFPRLPVSIYSSGPQGFSPLPPPNIRLWFQPCHFSLPCQSLPPSSLWLFILLTCLSSVGCILGFLDFFMTNIHLLVNICHGCPFGSELPLSGW